MNKKDGWVMRKSIKYGIALLAAAALITGVVGCGASSTADNTQQSASANNSGYGNGKGNRSPGQRGVGMFNNQALLSMLKIDQQTLQNDLKDGKTLVDIGKEQGVTEDQIVNILVQQRMDAAKKQGKTDDEINQSKVQWTDQAKKQAENKKNFNRGGNGYGNGQYNNQGNNQGNSQSNNQ
jgi:hypothetical protein